MARYNLRSFDGRIFWHHFWKPFENLNAFLLPILFVLKLSLTETTKMDIFVLRQPNFITSLITYLSSKRIKMPFSRISNFLLFPISNSGAPRRVSLPQMSQIPQIFHQLLAGKIILKWIQNLIQSLFNLNNLNFELQKMKHNLLLYLNYICIIYNVLYIILLELCFFSLTSQHFRA